MDEIKEKAIIVGANVNYDDFEISMQELKQLAEANNYEVVYKITQNLKSPDMSTYVGTGKVKEIKEAISANDVDLIIFNNELTTTQLRNLEKELNINILDRTSLILQIFADRAQTREAKLQVEVAKLEYMLPRLAHMHSDLGRQSGGSANNRGSGEKQIELDRRIIESRLDKCKKDLEDLNTIRETQSKKRKNSLIPRVAIVGYTNAGKSTLLNSIIDKYNNDENSKDNKKVYEEDMLFATLETNVRNIKFEDNKEILLADTVGFIRQLPHNLIKAFRSTLYEAKEADLLLHVIDYSDKEHEVQMKITQETLKYLKADNIPTINVFNKCDLIDETKLSKIDGDNIYISAKKNIGLDELVEIIKSKVFNNITKVELHVPFENGNIVDEIMKKYKPLEIDYDEKGTKLVVELNDKDLGKYQKYFIDTK